MKTFLRLILFVIGVGIVAYGIKNIPLKNISQQISNQNIYFQSNNKKFIQDWTTVDVVSKINLEREKMGLSELKLNEKLNKAASNRLSVILTENDYEGSVTGVTREAAVKNAGYNANSIGDLVLLDYFRTNDPIVEWTADNITKDTLYFKDFREIGIAVKNEQDTVSVYAVLVSPVKVVSTPAIKKSVWSGPELWTAVNKRRVERGVNPLNLKEELCTIASIRLNQLLELGKLDGHAGFVPTLDRSDLKWISEKYNISEFLASGYNTPTDTVDAWENTLGHKELLTGGQFVWGCVYAQSTFAVAIAAY